jgi:cytidine deaminase
MLKHRQTHIVAIVAVRDDGAVLPPCGRCRELIRQVDPRNWQAHVIVADQTIVTLASLLPHSLPASAPKASELS